MFDFSFGIREFFSLDVACSWWVNALGESGVMLGGFGGNDLSDKP